MTSFVVKNNAESTVADNPLAQAAVTLNVAGGEGANFPSTFPFLITIWDDVAHPDPGDDSGMEIVKCTGRSTDALTIVRAQEGTGDVAHALDERVAMLITAGIFSDVTYGVGTTNASIWLGAEGAYLPATNPAALTEVIGTTVYGGWSFLAFDDATSETAIWRVPMPGYNGYDIEVTAFSKPATTPSGAVTLQFNILAIGLANSEAFDSAVLVDTTDNISQAMDTTELNTDICVASKTIDPSNVAVDDLMVFGLSRDVASDDLVGDGQLIGVLIEYVKS